MLSDLRPGVMPDQALRVVSDLLTEVKNGPSGIYSDQVKSNYLTWLEKAEGQIRNVFAHPGAWEGLYTDIHFRIRTMGPDEPRPMPLMSLEYRRQTERLEQLTSEIKKTQNWLDRSSGRSVVVDTNVLLHYVPPHQIDWSTVIESEDAVRLIVPLRVVNELDEKKYVRDDRIGKRARSVLGHLGHALLVAEGESTTIAAGVTLEVAPFQEPRERSLDADWEILSCCLALGPYAPDLILTTGDTAMRIRAEHLGIESRMLPDEYLRSTAD